MLKNISSFLHQKVNGSIKRFKRVQWRSEEATKILFPAQENQIYAVDYPECNLEDHSAGCREETNLFRRERRAFRLFAVVPAIFEVRFLSAASES